MTRATAREYLRVSKGADGQERSTGDQHRDHVRAADDLGFALGEPYVDRGSASRYATRERDDFPRLLSDLENDRFGAQVLMLWESSRGSRRTAEWCALLDLCETRGVKIHVTSHERTYNPSNYHDHHALLSGAVDSEHETRRLSARTRRGTNSAAADGRPHGTCPFGYARDHEMVNGKMRPVRQYPHPEEAPMIRDLFERIKDGESFKSVAQDWAARGITGRRGRPFSHATLRDMITRVHYIGKRTHKGEETQARWESIVDPALFWEVQRLIADPARRTNTGGGIRHAVSMTLKCDACGGPMAVRARKVSGRTLPPGYECLHKGCARINKADVDAYLIGDTDHPGVILRYLSRPDVYAATRPDYGQGAAEADRAELARECAELAELEAATPGTLAEARVIARAVEAKEAKIRELEDRIMLASRPNQLAELFAPGGDVPARWAALEVTRQRQIAALLLSPEMLGEARIIRSPLPGLSVPVVDRLVWRKAGE